MGGFFKRITDSLKKMEKGKKTRLIVLITIGIVVVIVLSVILGQTSYSTLYTGLDSADAGQIITALDEMGVEYKAQGTGTILVPESEVDSVRMQLAAQGIGSSDTDTSIYELASGLSATDADKQVYYQWQEASRIASRLETLSKVDRAYVSLDLPEESVFALSDDEEEPTAGVTIDVAAGQTLTAEDASAIAELVASGISGLEPESVSIVDTEMNSYTVSGDDEAALASTQIQLEQTVQSELQNRVMSLLTPVFGEETIISVVNVELNFDTKTTESIEFEPPVEGSEEGIVVSMQNLSEKIYGTEDGGVAGVDSNGGSSTYVALDDEDATYVKTTEEANYELNQIKTMIEEEKGQIEELSVSVIIDSNVILDDYTENVKELVSTAIGVDAARVTVQNLPFAEVDTSEAEGEAESAFEAQEEILASIQSASTMRLVILVVGGIVVLFILLSIIRTLRGKTSGGESEEEGEGIDLVADEEIIPEAPEPEIHIEPKTDNRAVLGEYIDDNPETVANLLRNWLNDEE